MFIHRAPPGPLHSTGGRRLRARTGEKSRIRIFWHYSGGELNDPQGVDFLHIPPGRQKYGPGNFRRGMEFFFDPVDRREEAHVR